MINFSSILNPGERVVATGRQHAGALIVPFLALLAGAAVLFLQLGQTLAQFRVVGALFLIAGVWATVKALAGRLTTQFVLTDERLLGESGLLRHRKIALPIREIERIEVRNSLLGMMLGYGTLEVTGRNRLRERYSQITGAKGISRQVLTLMTAAPKVMPQVAWVA